MCRHYYHFDTFKPILVNIPGDLFLHGRDFNDASFFFLFRRYVLTN